MVNIKSDADYYATYVTRMNEEIQKEKDKKTAAEGTDDLDKVTAETDAVIAFYTEIREYKQADADHALAEYNEFKRVYELNVE